MNIEQLAARFAGAGAVRLYAKQLSENDNSKNQIYFAGTVEALNIFPSSSVVAENTNRGPSFKARLDFGWLLESGEVAKAPGAQLILYSQYPEVRFSGFLRCCENAPSDLMMDRKRARDAANEIGKQLLGRILFMGVTAGSKIIGYVAAGNSEIAGEYRERCFPRVCVVFSEIPLRSAVDARSELLRQLCRIHHLGWINAKQLDSMGVLKPCNASQCGGFTLEAELGIPKNSAAEPDYMGWEVKQHAVASFERLQSGVITLMTPEPTGGFYKDQGPEQFVRRYGYLDRLGRPDRLNFGGIHRVGQRHARTQLTLTLTGYDSRSHKITDAAGRLELISDDGECAASWAFSGLFEHWSRKHAQAAYVPSRNRKEPEIQYCYGNRARLAVGTDALRLLRAFSEGAVYYDPGIKVEDESSSPKVKRRNQFRVASRKICTLYETVSTVEVCND
jgi:hypothetical protein